MFMKLFMFVICTRQMHNVGGATNIE